MNIQMKKVNRGLRMECLFAFVVLAITFTACKKDEVSPEPVKPEETAGTVPYYKLQRVENFAATTDNNTTTAAPTVYFSLENRASVIADYVKTTRWDVAFGGLFNSFLSANNGSTATNHGVGTSAKGGILILAKSFDEVTEIPADASFKTTPDVIGTDDAGDYGAGMGWYLYDFNGTKVRDGAYANQHVAYALGANSLSLKNGTTIPARTIVVRTAKGNYAKIKMISCYKDAYTLASWSRDTPHMYFTFEYVLVPAGSSKFEIK